MRFRERLMRLMVGRYGMDETFILLFGFAAVLALVNCFLQLWPLQLAVYLIGFLAFLRAFSRNIEARTRENRLPQKWFACFAAWRETKRRQNADRSHIYRKCPRCKAVLRLPRRKGRHKTVCPRCNRSFSVTVFRENHDF